MVSVLLLCWAVLSLLSPDTCRPLRLASSLPGHATDNLEAHRLVKTQISMHAGLMEKLLNKRMQDSILRTSKGIVIYLKSQSKGCFSVLNVMSKNLCLDSKRKLLLSADNRNEDCSFHRVKRCQPFDTICSCRDDMWNQLQQNKPNSYTRSSSKPRLLSLEQHKEHTPRRKRYNWHVDPSDPLGSEDPIVRTISDHRVKSDHGSNVSKETITSVDDPLQVLLPHSPLSPTLEKDRKTQQVWF